MAAEPGGAARPERPRPQDRSRPQDSWSVRLVGTTPRPWTGLLVGVVGIVVVAVVIALLEPTLARSVGGFLYVVPVVLAAVVGGRWPSYVVAVGAVIGYSLRLPPVGRLNVTVAEDAVALAVLLGVALLVSTLVTGRIEAFTRLERDRALLLRSVSHDLRTPLGTIRAAATDLLDESDGEADRATRRHLLELIDHDARRLDRLVANLLSLSRIEADAMRPQRVPTDVEPLVAAAVRRAGSLDPDVEVRGSVDEGLPLVELDPVMFDQVLANLLDNAVRHSPPGEAVEVTATSGEDRTMTLSVADRGPGVTDADVELIFQPFRSGQMAGSSGVGLAISRAIVNAHGGTISVHPRTGGGALFVVTIDVE